MRKTNFILILSLLMSSCGQNDLKSNIETKNRSKRELSKEQVVVKKTPEETLREKLSEEEKRNLDFLKEALGNENNFNKFLSHDESKIKGVLEHIKEQLKNCNGNATGGKETFKQVLKGSFEGHSNDLDKFKSEATSTCHTAGIGGLGVGG